MRPYGFLKSWRKELESDIWKMPPLYHRVWTYVLKDSSWKKNEFPTAKKFKIVLLPGQAITSMNLIAKGVSWLEYGVEKTPNRKTIKKILEWLEFNQMIALESNRHGTYISICNWDEYQSKENDKVTPSGQRLGQRLGHPRGHTKEVKEVKEGEEYKHQCPHLKIIDQYNLILGNKLPKVKKGLWSGTRKTNLQSRWKEQEERKNIEWWIGFFTDISNMPFLVGNSKIGWKADMGWIIKSSNMVKILEGNYKTEETSQWE